MPAKKRNKNQRKPDSQQSDSKVKVEKKTVRHENLRTVPCTNAPGASGDPVSKKNPEQRVEDDIQKSDKQKEFQVDKTGLTKPMAISSGEVTDSTLVQTGGVKLKPKEPDLSSKLTITRQEPGKTQKETGAPSQQDISHLTKTAPISSKDKGTSDISYEKNSSKMTDSVKIYVKLNINFKINQEMENKFLPGRPKPGEKGRKIELLVNCLDVQIHPLKIFMYDVELTNLETSGSEKKIKSVTNRLMRKENFKELVKKFLEQYHKTALPVFDGGRIIFSNRPLTLPGCSENVIFDYLFEGENVKSHLKIQHVKEEGIELETLNHYVKSGTGRTDEMPHETLRALDTIIREMMLNKNLISSGRRAVFNPISKPLVCGPFVLMEGYSFSFRPHMWNIRFNFDKTQMVCHKSMKLLEYIGELRRLDDNITLDRMKLNGIRVQSNHLKTKDGKPYSRKYTIFGISKFGADREIIPNLNLTVEQYFKKKYNIQLQNPKLKMVQASNNPENPNHLPMELLTILPFQKVNETDKGIIQEVIKSSAIPCFDRKSKLEEAVKILGLDNRFDKFLKNYLIDVDTRLISVSGRVLDKPEAEFGGGYRETLFHGKWDLRQKKFLKPYEKKINWAMFAVGMESDYKRNEGLLYDVEEKLPFAARKVGLAMNTNYRFAYVSRQNIEAVASEIIKESEMDQKKLDLLVFILLSDRSKFDKSNEDAYRTVKRFGDIICGIVTQCMKIDTLQRQKNMDQYLANILLKINGKLGGQNWEICSLDQTFAPINRSFMIFGIDVTHPDGEGANLSKSIAAMVASVNQSATLYSAILGEQISKDDKSTIEVILDMKKMVYELLFNFYKVNKALKPERLIFYRDGVSEGQFRIVYSHEVYAIHEACKQLEIGYEPRITYIIVQKRHRIRLFPKNESEGFGKCKNVPPGTVVDQNITHSREFDFYLCSHEGIQGTSKPAHYHVLRDDNNFGSDDLQKFTFHLCHLYARCSRSVSYPAPTYYAHLAAFRGRVLIERNSTSSKVSSALNKINDFHKNKLFFI